MQTRIEAVISARFDQLLGRERIEQEIEESAKKVASIGTRAAQSVAADVISQVPQEKVSQEDLKSFEKIQKAFEASGRITDEKSKELITEFDYKRSLGMTETQWKSFEKRFSALGDESSEEMKNLEQFIRKEYSGVNDEKVREYFDQVAGIPGKIDFTKDYQEHVKKAKAYDKVFKFEEEGEELLSDFERKRQKGMTEAQEERYADKLTAYKEKIEDFQTKILPKYDLPDTEQAKIEENLKQLTENATKSYGLIKNSIEETITTQDSFFKQLQQAGYITMASGILNQAGKIAVAGATIEAKEKTSFDMTSAVGMYTEREQYELFKQNTERSIMATTAGMILGGGIGLLAGGAIGASVGGAMGSGIGSTIAEYFNKQAEGEYGERIKLTQQAIQMGMARVEEFRPYEIELRKASGKFGEDLGGSSGVGYTMQQELQFKEKFGDSLKRYDEELYTDQLNFARANYLKPDELMKINSYSRLTGQEYDTKMLAGAEEVAKGTFGPGMSKDRIVEVLESIAEINKEMLKHSANADSRDALKFAGIAEALFGVTNPYGRLGDLGMNTIKGIAELGEPKSEAHEAFLFRAYSRANGGKLFGEEGFLARKDSGIFYTPEGKEGNLELVLRQLKDEANKSPEMAQSMIWAMTGKDVTAETRLRLSSLVADETIKTDVYKMDKEGNFLNTKGEIAKDVKEAAIEKVETKGVEGFLTFLDEYKNKLELSGKTQEEIQKIEEDIKKKALGAATSYENSAEEIARKHRETADLWKEKTLKMIIELEEYQKTWLNSGQTIERSFSEVGKGLEYFLKKLAEQGIYMGEKGAKEYFNNEKYDALYKRAYTYMDNGRGFGDKISDEELKKTLQSGGRNIDEYKEYLANIMTERTTVLRGDKPKEVSKENSEYQNWMKILTADKVEVDKKEVIEILRLEAKRERESNSEEQFLQRYEERKNKKTTFSIDEGKNWRESAIERVNEQLANKGYSAKMISGYRKPEEQEKLVLAGKGEPDSSHTRGYAFDVQYSKNGRALTNEEAYKEIALRATLKQIEQIHPDIESGAFYKKNPIGEVNHFEAKKENLHVTISNDQIDVLAQKLYEGVRNGINGFNPNINIGFHGFADKTQSELENAAITNTNGL